MAEAFALAASVIGVLGFTLQLWTETAEIRKSGSTIDTADCARNAADLQKLCDQVKSLQDAQSDLAEAVRIKQIAAEIRAVAEELAVRLAKCELPADQKGLRRYRDVISVLWHGMRMDADSQMRRLSALRDELQSELLVSMSKKLDLGALRQTSWFEALGIDVKQHTDAILQEQQRIRRAIDDREVSAERRHEEVLQRLDHPPVCSPGSSGYSNTEARKKHRIRELCDRLWFDAIPRRHHAIDVAHHKTFEWIFTGQKKTNASNTTFLEWMDSGQGLYWVSGRAGTGKSSLMKFLEDDPRTEPTFKEWAGKRKLVLATFYFWNSEAANDDRLKSLSGLYRGMLYSLINQEAGFAELMFPNHFIDGRSWEKNFPTVPDMDEAFERLANAKEPPAAVGLIIDGLDEYDASNAEQMAMAENLRRASHSPNLKILVSSRPEDAFETIFRDTAKLRLHELTEQDRQTYTSDKLEAVPRFSTIATEAEQGRLIDLIVERSEGIFLWVKLAVETVSQEIDLSMNTARLEKVVQEIPSGNKELSRLFDHILRNRIPAKHRLLGYGLIQTMQLSYTLPDRMIPWVEGPGYKHQITTVLLSFFKDDVESALGVPIGPLDVTEASSRAELGCNLIRKACCGLLETRDQSEPHRERGIQYSQLDPPVHYIHKDLALYLSQEDTTLYLRKSFSGAKYSVQANLLKCFVIMMKFHHLESEQGLMAGQVWDIWRFAECSMRIARDAEVFDPESTVKLLDELDRVMIHLHSIGLVPALSAWSQEYSGHLMDYVLENFLDPTDGTHWSAFFPIDTHFRSDLNYRDKSGEPEHTNFIAFTVEQGLVKYCQSKIAGIGRQAITKPGRPLLSSACGNPRVWWHIRGSIRHETVDILLQYDADPNEAYSGMTCWQTALCTTHSYIAQDVESFRELEKVLRLMLQAGADPHANLEWTTRERTSKRNWTNIKHVQSAIEVIENTFIHHTPELPWPYASMCLPKDVPDPITLDENRREIARLGVGLLDLLKEKQIAAPRRKRIVRRKIKRSNTGDSIVTMKGISRWRELVSRRTRVWSVRFRARFQSKPTK
ncbi:hypothetical protein QBC37DRAFT_388685 [Rhypophila decipiens]|uniref:NACHT domain-containing protein n=1 Tax=Rhypophila decipiens TaxID=261697 RepID=A0AAN6Y635_9PEZI|nr:hypothetical protein QBC37DRAFT_388685 [Rhypophila decipiens]